MSLALLTKPVVAPCYAYNALLQVSVSLTCLGPVTDMPLLTIAYVLGNMVVKQDLQLPVGTHKFIMPEPGIPKEYFFDQWKAVSG